jgi:hypothetical protein
MDRLRLFGRVASGLLELPFDDRRGGAQGLPQALGVEIDVDVRHALAAPVQEALEEQPVGQGVDVGDAQDVGDDGVGRGAPSGGAAG